ncbi:hypothetical protein IEN85_10465 [Pelagicoccus sp. NFK12]|uniref:Uncharacterized protein n=1 Tax=Pelagicoccus enzymogenes TaxID=2773457 RepID=A0A927IH77_9BACT|nr:hypothetical protein [Pelagicoccus enzymogenes]MBD5779911.1 hypothetical protein [Pelagicoccus enzymogenes]
MNTEEIFQTHFGKLELSLRDGQTVSLQANGSANPIFAASPVRIVEDLGKEETESPGNIVRSSYRLSEIEDPFWLALFAFFQQSGFSVFIDGQGILRVTTFEGLQASTLGIARNCIRLANSTYKHYATRAQSLAYANDKAKGIADFKQDDLNISGEEDIAL